jgi:hypothetical protein
MDSIPNGTPRTGKLSARNWPAQFGGRGRAKPALPTPINEGTSADGAEPLQFAFLGEGRATAEFCRWAAFRPLAHSTEQ